MGHRTARRVLAVVLGAAAGLVVLLAGALITGLISVVVTSGVSMNPVYYQGDLVVVARADSYQVGEIVGYSIPGKNFVALHRITGEDADGFVMKGDNNQSIDPYHPNSSQIVGHAVLHIPQVGRWFQILTSPVALAVAAFALTVFGGTTIRTRRRKKRAAMAQRAPRPNSVTQSVLAMPRNLQIAVAVAGVAGLLGVVLAAVAWTRSSEQIASSSSKESRQMNFSYTAEVPPSPAYDGTTVHSPEPVFRKLTNTVDVHLSYQGVPGTIAVDAELSTPSGWHSTVPLAPPATFTADEYLSSVTLDTELVGRARAGRGGRDRLARRPASPSTSLPRWAAPTGTTSAQAHARSASR